MLAQSIALVILAAEDSSPAVTEQLTQYGPLGIFAILLIVFARTSYKRETERADRLEQEVFRLNAAIQERVIPALTSATNVLEEAADLLRDMAREQQQRSSHRRSGRDGGS